MKLKAINDKRIPIIIYNIPGRSDRYVGDNGEIIWIKNNRVKDATGDLNSDQTSKKMGKDFIQLTGNDDNALEFNKRGGVEQ